MDWEVDLDSPPLGPLTYIPVFQRLALITTDGHMHMIDIKKAEHLWRFPLDSRNPGHDIFASRLSAKNVEKLNLKWEKKGWTAWAPCSESRLCIYNPDKGQLIGRISAAGGVLTPPLFVGKGFYLLTAEKKPESKLRYRVFPLPRRGHFQEESQGRGD
ncbi:MAG: hypothetical protein IPK68_22425 [Bdellovibrionales bacterium]|nr:hypothetical protein [Bdellovibrionales bacterium]